MLSPPALLTPDHVLDRFDCGTPALNDWLKRRAQANQANDTSRTFVVAADHAVAAYYCLAAGAIDRAGAPKTLQRNRPDPLPVVVLGRLAIDLGHQNRGLGTALLSDAILRTLQAAEHVAVTAILVHALSEDARRFYVSRGFLPSPIQAMTLCLPLETARRGLETLRHHPASWPT